MSTQSGRSFRGRLSDGKHDDFIFQILAQLDEFNLQLKILESQISKPNDQEVVVIVEKHPKPIRVRKIRRKRNKQQQSVSTTINGIN